ncbi:LuxR family transcriptional regulator (plasmid) [Rhizobium sp. CB3171]|uniref:helix-turn-helix transcriptional regulator n=1 Tax=Rhizobium sp. CB3171 TaxID=3039157 RepID=UPI0024B255D8|nr:LuxR family transcriptional regulator [Rhizobium sp. CB3171]WFU06691.1 LuxR family transcriptional regulator [Rhizobium sp. CB3171]
MSALPQPAFKALAITFAEGSESRGRSGPATSRTDDKMACHYLTERENRLFRDGCGSTQVSKQTSRVADLISSDLSRPSQAINRGELAVEFGRFLDQTHGIAQSKQLFEHLSAFALNFGCTWIAYGPLTIERKVLQPVRRPSLEILNYPDEWQKRCLEMGYDRKAPIIKESRMRSGPIQWREAYVGPSTTPNERRIFDEAASFGVRSGITIPLRSSAGSFAIMSFAQQIEREYHHRAIAYLQLAAIHFHLRLANVADSNPMEKVPELSLREKECILWVARGKSSWDIGIIMNISENTVNFHIKNVMRKLDAASRTVAAIKAINLGFIEL